MSESKLASFFASLESNFSLTRNPDCKHALVRRFRNSNHIKRAAGWSSMAARIRSSSSCLKATGSAKKAHPSRRVELQASSRKASNPASPKTPCAPSQRATNFRYSNGIRHADLRQRARRQGYKARRASPLPAPCLAGSLRPTLPSKGFLHLIKGLR
jgi:hypothetical protein